MTYGPEDACDYCDSYAGQRTIINGVIAHRRCSKHAALYHLTLTGFEAGRPLCDIAKTHPGDKFIHFQLASDETIARKDMCPTCRWVAETPELDSE